MNKVERKNILILLFFSLVFLATRVPRLHNDTINPDGVNWHYRTQQFMNGIKYHQWDKTYQHYHPGVTLMWITGISTEVFKQITGIKQYSIYTFQAYDFVSKFGIIFVQLVLSLYIIFILRKFFGIWGATIMVSLFTFEPFFVGNSRLYHLDVLAALFLFSGLITLYLAHYRNSWVYYITGGILLSAAFLTKSIAISGIIYFVLWYVVLLITRARKAAVSKMFITIISFLLFMFVIFPALWVDPVHYISQIFAESERVGLRRGHEQLLFGQITDEASLWFYGLVLLMKVSPFLLLGLLFIGVYSYRLKHKYRDQLNGGLLIFLLGYAFLYFAGISLASKKIDRYLIIEYPFLAMLSFYGYKAIAKIKGMRFVIASLLVSFVIWPLFRFFPYYFTYTSPLFGSSLQANKVVGQKPFGIGMYDLRDFIVANYSSNGLPPNLGFIDTKPMESIYPNSKVFDIRVDGTNKYDLIVLGINEELPTDTTNFVKSGSYNINGLEYWRIYEKQK